MGFMPAVFLGEKLRCLREACVGNEAVRVVFTALFPRRACDGEQRAKSSWFPVKGKGSVTLGFIHFKVFPFSFKAHLQ